MMDKRRFGVFGLCLAVCLAIAGAAMAATIPSGAVTYWDGHYLAGTSVPLGFDMFGSNYQSRVSNGFWINWALGVDGYPPYEGDDAAYYQRLVDESIKGITTVAEAEEHMDLYGWWGARYVGLELQWNEAYLSNKDKDGDSYLDWHPVTEPPHDMGGDFTGSGAAAVADWGWIWDPAPIHSTWAAVPSGAYLEWKLVFPPWDCWCPYWYVGEGDDRVEIGFFSEGANMGLPGSTECWATVDQVCYDCCPEQEGIPHLYSDDGTDLGVVPSALYQSPWDWGNLKTKGPG